MSPVPGRCSSTPQSVSSNKTAVPPVSQRGTSPVAGGAPLRVHNSLEIKQQFAQSYQSMQAISMFPGDVNGQCEPPPPYPMGTAAVASSNPPPPPTYSQSLAMRQSPTLSSTSSTDYRRSPAPIQQNHLLAYNMVSSHINPSPIPPSPSPASSMMSNSSRSSSMQAWSSRQTKTHSPIIMQSVKSTQVQKPILQTATAVAPESSSGGSSPPVMLLAKPSLPNGVISGIATTPVPISTNGNGNSSDTTSTPPPPPPPSYEFSMQQKRSAHPTPSTSPSLPPPPGVKRPPPTPPTTSDKVLPPPPPYPSTAVSGLTSADEMLVNATSITAKATPVISTAKVVSSNANLVRTIENKLPLQRKYSPLTSETGSSASRSESPVSDSQTVSAASPLSFMSGTTETTTTDSGIGDPPPPPPPYKTTHHTSPKPERKNVNPEKEEVRRESLIKNCPPQAFKFFMEQHIENVIKESKQRSARQMRLEKELAQLNVNDPVMSEQMRCVLRKKETNYLRMKRAKLNKKHFKKIKAIGVGAFGEVSLVRNIDQASSSKSGGLYAMKTLKKSHVVDRNQVAHVIAEKDILAEADNDWIVKLYYSFQVIFKKYIFLRVCDKITKLILNEKFWYFLKFPTF